MEPNETNNQNIISYDGDSEIIQKNSIYEQFFEHYKQERNPAKNTIIALKYIIPKFLKFYHEKHGENLNLITPEDIIGYLNNLPIRTSSRKMHLRFIALFFNCLFKYKLIDVKLPTVFYKGPPDIPRASQKDLDEKEIKKMIQEKERLSLPEKVIFELLISRPLRIGELGNLRVSAVDLKNKTITIYRSKNQKTRILSIPSVTYDGLSQLIKNKNPEDLIFGFAERTMYGVLNRIYKKLGIEKRGRSGHAFRHWVIMSMLYKLKRDVSVVAEDAGNSKKTIMSHYTERIPSEELRDTEKSMDRLLSKNVVESES